MALVGGTLIEEARDLHPSFHRRDHPDKVLLRELERYERQLLTKAISLNEDYQVTLHTEPLPLASFDAGFTLPTHLLVHDAEYQDLRGYWHAMVVRPMLHRYDPGPIRTCFMQGQTIYLRGIAADWTGIPAVRITYTPQPAGLATLSDVLTIGDSARPALITRLAFTMAKKGPSTAGTPEPDVSAFLTDWQNSEAAFLSEVAAMRNSEVMVIREVF